MLLGPLPNYRERRSRPRNFCGHRARRGSPEVKRAVWCLAGATVCLSSRADLLPSPLYVAERALFYGDNKLTAEEMPLRFQPS